MINIEKYKREYLVWVNEFEATGIAFKANDGSEPAINEHETVKRLNSLVEQLNYCQRENEELKAQLVDAIGDGFYDGYWKCINDAKSGSVYVDDVNECDVMEASEQHESEHRYSKSISDIRAKVLDDLFNELSEVPFVAANWGFLKERAEVLRKISAGGAA